MQVTLKIQDRTGHTTIEADVATDEGRQTIEQWWNKLQVRGQSVFAFPEGPQHAGVRIDKLDLDNPSPYYLALTPLQGG